MNPVQQDPDGKLTEDQIDALRSEHGLHKVNLIYPEGDSEGVWATFASAKDKQVYSASPDEKTKYTAILLNQPLGWQCKEWGDAIIATTQGGCRPEAHVEDNPV